MGSMNDPICPVCVSEVCDEKRCSKCAKDVHYDCFDSWSELCKRCLGKSDDGLQRDDNAARVRDMNTELRGGRFYR